jgi:cobaltochelatase CobS
MTRTNTMRGASRLMNIETVENAAGFRTYLVTGDTYAHRFKFGRLGGRWQQSPKGWSFPDNAATMQAVEIIVREHNAGAGQGANQDDAGAAERTTGRFKLKADDARETMGADWSGKWLEFRDQLLEDARAANPPTPNTPVPAAPTSDAQVDWGRVQAIANGAATYHVAPLATQLSAALDLVASLQSEVIALKEAAPTVVELREEGKPTKTLKGAAHKQLPDLIRALSCKRNVWLAGPSGSGKTHAAEQAAEALGLTFGLHGAMTMPHELVGFVDASGRYHTTPFVRAFTEGGLVLLDEIDAGSNEALLALNAALANAIMCLPSGDVVRRHDNFRCIGAANTFGQGATAEYVGRNRIDAAFLQRFGARIRWGYDNAMELAMCMNKDWVKRVQKARKTVEKAGIKVLITPRASLDGEALIAAGFTPDQAAEMTYLAGLTPEQVRTVEGTP